MVKGLHYGYDFPTACWTLNCPNRSLTQSRGPYRKYKCAHRYDSSLIPASGLSLDALHSGPHTAPWGEVPRGPTRGRGRQQAPAAATPFLGGAAAKTCATRPGARRLRCADLKRDLQPTSQPASRPASQPASQAVRGSGRTCSVCVARKTEQSDLPQVLGRARARTQVSGLPVGVLYQSCNSQPCLASGPSFAPHILSPYGPPGSPDASPEFPQLPTAAARPTAPSAQAQRPCPRPLGGRARPPAAAETPCGCRGSTESRRAKPRAAGAFGRSPAPLSAQRCLCLPAGQD